MPVFFSGFTVWSVILLVVGLGFLLAEVMNPGFGALGIIGIVALVLDILISAKTLMQGVLLALIVAVIVLVFLFFCIRMMTKGKMPGFMVLKEKTDKEEGFSASEDVSALLGRIGNAITPLRPAGLVDFAGKRVDVVTQGEFIEKGEEVIVKEIEGSRIVVCLNSERSK